MLKAITKIYNNLDPDPLEQWEIAVQSFSVEDYLELIEHLARRMKSQVKKNTVNQNEY